MTEFAELSFTVVKASYDKSEPDPNRKRRILLVSSDTSPDLYDEKMSQGLFKDFIGHIANNDPVPEVFRSAICEEGVWCGGMPYISIAHYRAGRDGKNVPGNIESVYIDGDVLKSKAFLHDTPLGRHLFDALCEDLEKFKSGVKDHLPVRVSIGFLDLEHKHEVQGKSVVFTRTALGQKCDLCEAKAGGKIYTKGYLVHLAATRVPVNQRTEMSLEEKSMNEITTKRDDAASIVGEELARELEQKSVVDDVLVVKADNEPVTPVVDTPKSLADEVATVKSEILDEVRKTITELLQASKPVVEESMDTNKEHEDKETEDKEKKEEEATEKSALDQSFETLKSLLSAGRPQSEVQAAFNAVGEEVKKSYVAPAPTAEDIAVTVKSAVEQAVAPLMQKIALLEATQKSVVNRSAENPASRALNLKVEDLVARSGAPVAPQQNQQLSQIQQIARRSVYGQ